MIKTGKCPGCKKTIINARVEAIDILEGFSPTWKGASFICPSCHCVLSVGFDPVALKAAIVEEVVQHLRKGA
jgi:hypothetical protein